MNAMCKPLIRTAKPWQQKAFIGGCLALLSLSVLGEARAENITRAGFVRNMSRFWGPSDVVSEVYDTLSQSAQNLFVPRPELSDDDLVYYVPESPLAKKEPLRLAIANKRYCELRGQLVQKQAGPPSVTFPACIVVPKLAALERYVLAVVKVESEATRLELSQLRAEVAAMQAELRELEAKREPRPLTGKAK